MLDGVGHVTRQDSRSVADFSHPQQVFPIQEVGIKAVVQLHLRVAAAPFDPLRRSKKLAKPLQVWTNFRVLSEDVLAMIRIQMQAMAEHILEHRRHTLAIPHSMTRRK